MRLWKPRRRSRRAGSQVPYFVRILLPGFHAALPLDPAILGIGTAPRVLWPHVELQLHIRYPMEVARRPIPVPRLSLSHARLGRQLACPHPQLRTHTRVSVAAQTGRACYGARIVVVKVMLAVFAERAMCGRPLEGRLKGRQLVPDGRRLVATRGDSGSTHLCTRLQRSFTSVRMLAGLERA